MSERSKRENYLSDPEMHKIRNTFDSPGVPLHFSAAAGPTSRMNFFEQPASPARAVETRPIIDLENISTFVPVFLGPACETHVEAVEENPSLPHSETNTPEEHNQTVRLSNARSYIPINNHTNSSKFSTFPQGLRRLLVFRFVFFLLP